MPEYAVSYRLDDYKFVCEILPSYHEAHARMKEIDKLSCMIYEIIKGPNDSETS